MSERPKKKPAKPKRPVLLPCPKCLGEFPKEDWVYYGECPSCGQDLPIKSGGRSSRAEGHDLGGWHDGVEVVEQRVVFEETLLDLGVWDE